MCRAIPRYLLVQLPAQGLIVLVLLGLNAWTTAPLWILWTIGLLWLAKDLVLFPFVWRAYADEGGEYPYSPIGRQGFAVERLDPTGRIKVGTEIWKAELEVGASSVEPGGKVRITGIRGLTLRVRAQDK